VCIDRHGATTTADSLRLSFQDAPQEEKHLGYNVAHDGSTVTMALSFGRKHPDRNSGVGPVRIALPKNISFAMYVDSLSHQLTPKAHAHLEVNDPSASPAFYDMLGREMGEGLRLTV